MVGRSGFGFRVPHISVVHWNPNLPLLPSSCHYSKPTGLLLQESWEMCHFYSRGWAYAITASFYHGAVTHARQEPDCTGVYICWTCKPNRLLNSLSGCNRTASRALSLTLKWSTCLKRKILCLVCVVVEVLSFRNFLKNTTNNNNNNCLLHHK